ncbi:uncharacterized protein LOC112906050 [Agrilus planipennis]|uniref:Uncharacterized protein LOC112906050 n=1 Tax=Agrilus planipennis TaxID=224129 RepID=A0A7F5RHR7_AGRPL|nr:uncharacterized protein LOC112906050 [Agrilus planipennis]
MKCKQKTLVFCIFFYTLCSCENVYNQTTNNKDNVANIKGFYLKNIASELGNELQRITSEELFVSNIQVLYKEFKYVNVYQDIENIVQITANKINEKLNESFHILNETKAFIESYDKNYSSFLESYVVPCNNKEDNPETSLQKFLHEQRENVRKHKESLKQIYFLSTHEIGKHTKATIFNCKKHDQSTLWKLYMERVKTKPKNVMLLVDHGATLNNHHLDIIKAMAKQMVSVLDSNHKIGVISISDDWGAPYLTDQCLMPNQIPPFSDFQHIMSPATDNNKYLINKFIDSLRKGNGKFYNLIL